MRKHYVKFYSPGTFFQEESAKPIKSWDVVEAVKLSKTILERYDAKPYAFRFTTMLEAEPVPDGEGGLLEAEPRQVDSSGLYFLGGTLLTYYEVKSKNDPKNSIMLSNMEGNNMWIIIENTNSWRFTGAFDEDACIVDEHGHIIRKGIDTDLVHYRAHLNQRKAEGKL